MNNLLIIFYYLIIISSSSVHSIFCKIIQFSNRNKELDFVINQPNFNQYFCLSYFYSEFLSIEFIRNQKISLFTCSGLNRLAPSIMCPYLHLEHVMNLSSVTPENLLLHDGCTFEDSSCSNREGTFDHKLKNLKKRIMIIKIYNY
ncbi:hypothetical protein pb186bvf_001222 [Paramecium bursaria]